MGTFRALVLIADGEVDETGEVFPKGCVIDWPEEPVWVCLDYGYEPRNLVGWATLEREGDHLYANIEFLRSSEEPILAKLYPGIGGVCTNREANLLKEITIRQIGLHAGKNADHRIPTLEEQGFKPESPQPEERVEPGSDAAL